MLKNWRTSLAGILGAVLQIVVLPVTGWGSLILPVCTAIIGLLSGDGKEVKKNSENVEKVAQASGVVEAVKK